MNKTTAITGTYLVISALMVSMVALAMTTSGEVNSVLAQPLKKFTANLAGKNEVPPVDTKASGTAQFQLSADGKQIDYDLITKDLNNFMMAHIHQGKASDNGQPVVTLSMGKGKITSADLQGPLTGKQLSDLVKLIESGETYVNVHTQQNQNGEIRGQIAAA
jgi:hypothetical protein